jgi:RNA polymerase sigma-70 factor (ECF subfamily)
MQPESSEEIASRSGSRSSRTSSSGASSGDEKEKRLMFWVSILSNAVPGKAVRAADAVNHAEARMDGDAFAGFYLRSARPLWAYLARVSGDGALADDLMQESFVRFLLAAPASLAEEGEVASRRYLFRIATNLMRDHWRRPQTTWIEELPEEIFAARTIDHDAAAMLSPALNKMRPRERQLLWLAHAEEYSHREIAEITGLASASIRLLLFRARRRMAKLLRDGHVTNVERAS